jgi:uncharacterized protein (DUF934 family)
MRYYSSGAFRDDPWAGRPLLTAEEWRQKPEDRAAPLGLALTPGFAVDSLAAEVARFDLISIAFPKFTDGRGYSMGWLLRTRFGFTGEMRATGDVLYDEMQLMGRCGFDAFEVSDLETIRLLESGRQIATFDRFYQPGLEREVPAGTRPWARRAALAEP